MVCKTREQEPVYKARDYEKQIEKLVQLTFLVCFILIFNQKLN